MRAFAFAFAMLTVAGCRAKLGTGDPQLYVPCEELHPIDARAAVGGQVWIERGTEARAMQSDQALEVVRSAVPPSVRAPVQVQVWVPTASRLRTMKRQ